MNQVKLQSGVTLVLGGARSGKSRFAENLILGSGLKPVYLATGRAFDEEMSERIAIHQARRDGDWKTVEEPLALADALLQSAYEGRAVLVDCLTLWITNLMMAKADVMTECESVIAALPDLNAPIVFVSNEVGLGIVPDNAEARAFRDLAGKVHERLAIASQQAYFVAAGMPMVLKAPESA